MKPVRTFVALLLLVGLQSFCHAQSTDGLALEIIYDTSGSMVEKIPNSHGGTDPKYVIANRALNTVINQLVYHSKANSNQTIEVGLITFNGGSPAEVIHLSTFKPRELRSFVADFNSPEGNTPLGNSIRLAGNVLLASKQPHRHILIVTDGLNTSGPDPTQVVPQLQKEDANIEINVIGLNVGTGAFEDLKKQNVTVVEANDEQQLRSEINFILKRKILLEEEETSTK